MSGLVEFPEPARDIRKVTDRILELRKWSIFTNVDPELLSKVKLAYVFGHEKTTGLMVTDDGEVYSVGSNQSGRLGIGSESPEDSSVPVKVEALCGKGVEGFTCYSSSTIGTCFALTQSGLVYSWGTNAYGGLGLGPTTNTFEPTLIQGLSDKRVVQLSCGWCHALVLTSEGEVFSWGHNGRGQVGNGTTEQQSTPIKVAGLIEGVEISAVSCGDFHSVALSKAGELSSWGFNCRGQLGNGTNTDAAEPIPVRITLPDNEPIVKIANGPWHSMALTKGGKLYSWGGNAAGQLGTGSTTDSATPIAVQGLGSVLDIACVNYMDTSPIICVTDSNVYVWGNVNGKKTYKPIETGLTSIPDAFWVYTSPQVMHKPVVTGGDVSPSPSLIQDLEKAFNDKSTADVEFFSQREKKNVFVHKQILQIRSTHFRTMFDGDWKESAESSFPIDPSISFRSFHAFLFFLYTDKVEFPENDFENILDLMKLADCYDETRLREQCELILKRGITIQNAMGLYTIASAHNAKVLQDFASKFILEHREQIPEEGLATVELDEDHEDRQTVDGDGRT